MDVPKWYAISLGTIVVACLLYRVISGILAFIRKITTFFFLKHFTYPNLHRRILWIGTATRIQVLSVIAYISGNILCMTIGSTTMSQVTARAGILSIINMIPLLVGPRLAMVADLVGISIRTNLRIHEWIGRMAILQGMIHTILPFVGHRPFRWDSIRSSGVVVRPLLLLSISSTNVDRQGSIALGAILLGSFKITRSIAYEVFLRTHILVSVVIVVSLWYHLKQQNTSTRIYLWINLSVWALTTALHWAIFIFRNVVLGRPFARATVSYLSDAFQVDVVVPRPWHVKAGQYVYLTIPGAGTWSALEGHPFMISWWARDERGLTCSLLVQPRRGFSSRMFKRLGSPLRAFIDGPYGLNHEFGQYGTVIMFATGIGIAAQLPYVKELINGYNNCEVRTRSVQLHWVMEKDCKQQKSASSI